MAGRVVWAGLWGVLAMVLAPSVAEAQCTKDTDCKGERVCEQGKCTWPAPPAPGAVPAVPPAAASPGEPPAAGTPAAAPPVDPSVAPDTTAPDATGTPTTPSTEAPVVEPPRGPVKAPAAARKAPPPALDLPPPKDEPPVQRRSRPALISGIVLVSIGPLALLGALAAKNSQDNCDEELERDYPDHVVPTSERYRTERCDSYTTPMYVLGIGGALLTGVGVPLIVYGAKTKPRQTVELQPWATPRAGGMSGGLKVRLSL